MGSATSVIEALPALRGRAERLVVALVLAPALAFAMVLALAPAAHAGACAPAAVEHGEIAGLAGGGDLRLIDGRVVRLAAIATDFGNEDHAEALRTALGEMAVGRRVEIASAGAHADRYGRIAGMVRVEGMAEGETLQDALVGLGLAVAWPEDGYVPCAAALGDAEEAARAASLGLWAVLPADGADPDAVRRMTGRLGVVEGRIFAAGSGRNSDYLNFGRIWREDVTVRIPRRAKARFVEAGLTPESLARRRVLVRGVIFEAGGPAMELRWPEQLRVEGN